jgi:hypothetical protein
VIHVPNRTHVHVRLRPLKLALGHRKTPSDFVFSNRTVDQYP